MHQFTKWTGTTVPIMNDNIDTDQLLPKQFLKLIDKKGFGKYLLYAWRYLDDHYTDNPDFILNQPAYQGASILISGDNFGAGSSREHAAWALADYGFKVIIAGSFGDIHYNNDLNNGILPIVQPKEIRDKLAQLAPDQTVTVDLETQLLHTPFGEFHFDIDKDWKHKLLNGLDDIGITLQYQDLIEEYEQGRPAYWQN
ncbi:TPA: 3-isopropylmalate dehydratase small subunit [Streptococcus suis]